MLDRKRLTEISADAVKPVRTVRLAVMNLDSQYEKIGDPLTYISVFLLSSPVVFFRILVIAIITALLAALLSTGMNLTTGNDKPQHHDNDISDGPRQRRLHRCPYGLSMKRCHGGKIVLVALLRLLVAEDRRRGCRQTPFKIYISHIHLSL